MLPTTIEDGGNASHLTSTYVMEIAYIYTSIHTYICKYLFTFGGITLWPFEPYKSSEGQCVIDMFLPSRPAYIS